MRFARSKVQVGTRVGEREREKVRDESFRISDGIGWEVRGFVLCRIRDLEECSEFLEI